MTENYYKFGGEGDSFRFDYNTPELCCVLCKDKYNGNCLYCCKKDNIIDKSNYKNIDKDIMDKGMEAALSCGNFTKKSCKTVKVIIKQENKNT